MINRAKLATIFTLALAALPLAIAQPPAGQPQGVAAVVPADQQPTAEQVNRLFDVMRIEEQLASTTKMMPQLMQQQFTQQVQQMQSDHPERAKLTPAQQEASAKVMRKFMEEAMALYTGDEMITDMKAVYQRHLTGNDVENLITFYNSPSGQHMLDMVPAVMQEFVPAFMQKMQGKMRPLIADMSKELAQIAESTDAPAKPSEEKPKQDKPDQH